MSDLPQRQPDPTDDDVPYMTAEVLDAVMADDDANDPTLDYYQKKYGNSSAADLMVS